MARRKFPFLGVLLLVFGLSWMFEEMGIWSVNLPWIPIIVVLIAVSLIVNRYS